MRWSSILVLFVLSFNALALSESERQALFAAATGRLKASEIEKRAPKVGEEFPDLEIAGKKVSAWVKEAPLVLTFYRGGWCPYCVKQLKEISGSLAQFKHAQVIAISPETSMEVAQTKRKNGLKLMLLADKSNELARMLGIAFQLEEAVVAEYKNLGIDLTKSQGNSDHVLPLPATFVIGEDRKVAYVFVDADYRLRAPLPDVVKSVQRLMAP